jgi:hypothetical protein
MSFTLRLTENAHSFIFVSFFSELVLAGCSEMIVLKENPTQDVAAMPKIMNAVFFILK